MPTPPRGARLGGSPAHERLMLANLATSLFTHGRIMTTEAKAKRLRPFAERLISKARKADLHNRRQIMRVIRDKDVVHKLVAEIGPQFATRPGGYTRILKTMPRKGDNAAMAIIALVTERTAADVEEVKRRAFRGRPQPPQPAAKAEEPVVVDSPAESETLAEPETPAGPDSLAGPETPAGPDSPAEPETPAGPETPAEPGTPIAQQEDEGES